jgi:hypothetical protein
MKLYGRVEQSVDEKRCTSRRCRFVFTWDRYNQRGLITWVTEGTGCRIPRSDGWRSESFKKNIHRGGWGANYSESLECEIAGTARRGRTPRTHALSICRPPSTWRRPASCTSQPTVPLPARGPTAPPTHRRCRRRRPPRERAVPRLHEEQPSQPGNHAGRRANSILPEAGAHHVVAYKRGQTPQRHFPSSPFVSCLVTVSEWHSLHVTYSLFSLFYLRFDYFSWDFSVKLSNERKKKRVRSDKGTKEIELRSCCRMMENRSASSSSLE